jgi:hypothetical protein
MDRRVLIDSIKKDIHVERGAIPHRLTELLRARQQAATLTLDKAKARD